MKSRRSQGTMRTCGMVVVLLITTISNSYTARAETIYRWTSGDGVIHFSQSPPDGQEAVRLNVTSPDLVTGSGSESPGGLVGTGGAKLTITRRAVDRTGPSTFSVDGAIQNTGGETALNSSVLLVAMDAQKTECMRVSVAVTPDTILEGETATFSGEFTDPCLEGSPELVLTANWTPEETAAGAAPESEGANEELDLNGEAESDDSN